MPGSREKIRVCQTSSKSRTDGISISGIIFEEDSHGGPRKKTPAFGNLCTRKQNGGSIPGTIMGSDLDGGSRKEGAGNLQLSHQFSRKPMRHVFGAASAKVSEVCVETTVVADTLGPATRLNRQYAMQN